MFTKWHAYRAAMIFALADGGLTVSQIQALESAIADAFSDELPVDVAASRILTVQVEAG